MEALIARMLQDFENGSMTRRQLIHSLAVAASAVAAAPAPATAAGAGFKAVALDHVSYQVRDYKRTRDFYVDLMGMTVAQDNGKNQCELHFGESILLPRNRAAQSGQARVDHIAYRIANWDTDKVRAELDRRGMKPRLDTGRPDFPADYASFHVTDPDGFDLQISGVVGPGDSQYRRK